MARLGPGSFLSICSKSGIEWVDAKTGLTDFGQMARRLTFDVSRRLKLDMVVPTSREPDPEEHVAWQYARAYFDGDPDATYGIVNRPSFETMLRAHFKRDGRSETDNDPACYALRNVVFAAGCRVLSVASSAPSSRGSFMTSLSWRYFLNALSVHTDLLYFRTSLMAVQALATMVSRHR